MTCWAIQFSLFTETHNPRTAYICIGTCGLDPYMTVVHNCAMPSGLWQETVFMGTSFGEPLLQEGFTAVAVLGAATVLNKLIKEIPG